MHYKRNKNSCSAIFFFTYSSCIKSIFLYCALLMLGCFFLISGRFAVASSATNFTKSASRATPSSENCSSASPHVGATQLDSLRMTGDQETRNL